MKDFVTRQGKGMGIGLAIGLGLALLLFLGVRLWQDDQMTRASAEFISGMINAAKAKQAQGRGGAPPAAVVPQQAPPSGGK